MLRKYIISILLVTATLSFPAFAADEEAVATVNGVAVPKSRFDLLLISQTTQGQQDTPAFREELREIMITREVLAQEARRRKLNENDEFKQQFDAMEQQLLLTVLFNTFIEEMTPSEEQMQAAYERIKSENAKLGEKEYHVRHILVKEEGAAIEIIAQLDGGADFVELAKENSDDTGSKENGGDLGWSAPQRYVKPFADAIASMEKGETTSTPVKTDFGYHVIELVDVRVAEFPPYDQVKEQLRKEMLTKARDDLIGKLRADAEIEKIGSVLAE
jgi:peptidyl-prolyl cis-trans isomerase C